MNKRKIIARAFDFNFSVFFFIFSSGQYLGYHLTFESAQYWPKYNIFVPSMDFEDVNKMYAWIKCTQDFVHHARTSNFDDGQRMGLILLPNLLVKVLIDN
jgi:hypothetical protein